MYVTHVSQTAASHHDATRDGDSAPTALVHRRRGAAFVGLGCVEQLPHELDNQDFVF